MTSVQALLMCVYLETKSLGNEQDGFVVRGSTTKKNYLL